MWIWSKPNWNCIKCHSTWGKCKKHKQNCLYTQPKWLWAQIVQINYKNLRIFSLSLKGVFHCSDKKYRVDINQVWRVLCGILMCGKNNFLPRDAVDIRSIIRIYCKWISESISCANYQSASKAQSNLIIEQIQPD